ncbi:GNAT family N-acetyltransferase [Chitinimonas sp. BJYL2]|uniref:GNAT family N-acetyltransferase n=1 Tax=Chitinimonas sp. BJYL2 TaxID=2976696 RepID=UPI0022B42B48|nr:GNAT family protein [Chitinimonas sp. BJYL2]
MTFPVLHTDRLLLRELTLADTDALFAIHRDTEAMRWFGAEPITEREQAAQLIEMFASWRQSPNPGTRWAIEDRFSGTLLGTAGLFKWNRAWRNCVLGYELGRAYWGQGYMQEALHALLAYGFEVMRLNRIQAEIHPDNLASSRLVGRLGFVLEGRHRQQGYWQGQFHDLDCYSLLAHEWAPQRKSP